MCTHCESLDQSAEDCAPMQAASLHMARLPAAKPTRWTALPRSRASCPAFWSICSSMLPQVGKPPQAHLASRLSAPLAAGVGVTLCWHTRTGAVLQPPKQHAGLTAVYAWNLGATSIIALAARARRDPLQKAYGCPCSMCRFVPHHIPGCQLPGTGSTVAWPAIQPECGVARQQ